MATSVASYVTTILNAALEAIEHVIPKTFERGNPCITDMPIQQTELGVLIGITGDVKGRIYISSSFDVFASIGQAMYGMDLGGEMVHSFAAEFTNMVAGHMVRLAEGINLDISPPTTLDGTTKLYGFNRAILVPLVSEPVGTLNLALIMEEN